MKNKLILLMGAFAMVLVLVVVLVFVNLKSITLSIPESGAVVSSGKVIVVDEGSSVVQNTPVNLLVDHETVSNNAFYVSDDASVIIPLKDVFYVNEKCEIGYIKKNSVIEASSSGFEIKDTEISNKEMILYTPEDNVMAFLSPSIQIENQNYKNVVMVEVGTGGSFTVHDFTNGSDSEATNYILNKQKVTMSSSEYDLATNNYTNSEGKVINTKNTTTKDVNKDISSNEGGTGNGDGNGEGGSGGSGDGSGSGSGKATPPSPAPGVASPTSGLSRALEAFFAQLNESIPKIYSTKSVGWDYVVFDFVLNDPDGTLLSADLIVTEAGASAPTSRTSLEFVEDHATVKIGNLKPETKYNYRVEMTYYPKGEETRAIIESSFFKTNDYAVGMEFTEIKSDSMKINIKSNPQIKYKSGKIIIDDRQGDIQEVEIDFAQTLKPEGQDIEFTGLQSNHSYVIYFKELKVGEKYITIADETKVQTRKKTPIIQPPVVTVNFLESSFDLMIPAINDPDFLVESVDYIIYNATDTVNPVKVYTSKYHPTNNTYSFKEDTSILRNRNYRFQIVVRGYDNHAYQEVKSDITNSFALNGLHPPVAELIVTDVTPDSIEGTISIKDVDKTLIGSPKLVIKNGNTVIDTQVITALDTPQSFHFTGLSPLTNYTLVVEASFDLSNGQAAFTNYPILNRMVSTPLVR